MIQAAVVDAPNTKILEAILEETRRLSVREKLVLARQLLDEALEESLLPRFESGTVIELYSPIEVEGMTSEMIDRFEMLPKPVMS